jgi:hypothetical protein
VEDNSITSNAFKDVPRQGGITVDKAVSTYGRFAGMGSFNYWMFGFENSIVKVGVFVINTPSTEPTAGATYRDTDLNDFTFLRKEVMGSSTYHVFRCDDNVVPTLQTGNLTKQTGTGDTTLTMTAHSVLMYEHLYELDSHERHLTSYRTAEQISGWSSGDKKNRMATIGVKMGTNDFRYPNAMCKGFSFKSTAGDLATIEMPFIAYNEERGDYSSSSWTFPSTRNDSDNIIAHHQMKVEVGTLESSLTALGVTDVELGCEIPLQVIQDTVSGLYIAEPLMEGKYGFSCNLTLSRYSADTYQDLTDAWTSVVARIAAAYGYYRIEFLVNDAKISKSGPDDSDVAKEQLQLDIGYNSTNNWSTWLTGNSLIQSSPILYRVRDLDSTNHMFEI